MTSPPVRRGGRPAQISREKILEAAADMELDDLTMSAVAARLGVTHASLYKYFRSRAALVAAVMIDRGERMEVPDPSAMGFEDWVVEAGFRCRDHMVDQLAATRLLGPSGHDVVMRPLMDAFVGLILEAGFSATATADAWNLFRGCCLGAAADLRRIATVFLDPTVMEVWAEVTATFQQAANPTTLQWMSDIAANLDVDASFRRQLETLARAWRLELSAGAGGVAADAQPRKKQARRQ